MKFLLAIILLSVRCLGASAINVSLVATAGDGSAVSPWTGWDTSINWVAEQQYNFPSGVYAFCSSPNFLKTGIALVGEAGTVMKHTCAGNAVTFDNPGGLTPAWRNWTENVRMENFIIQGNAATTNGLLLRGVRNGIFRHISVRDVSNAGLWSEACVTNILENFRVTHHEMPNDQFNVRPAYGFVSASRGGDWSTTWTLINPVIEGTGLIGIWLQTNCYGNTIINGTSEGNLGKGAVIESGLNTIVNTDFEANGATDIDIKNSRNILQNVLSNKSVSISAGQANRLIGGQYSNISIAGNVDFTSLEGVIWNGILTDSPASTIKVGNQSTLQGGLRFDSYLNHVIDRMYQLPSGSVIDTDANRFSSFYFVAFQDFTLLNPKNGINGQAVTWRIQQDNTGGRVISFGSKFMAKGALPLLSMAPLEFDYITARYNLARDTWDIQ